MANRIHKKCHPRTIREFQDQLTELKDWIAKTAPPEHFREEWFAGLCAEPSQFTRQLINLRDSIREAGRSTEGQPEPVRVRNHEAG